MNLPGKWPNCHSLENHAGSAYPQRALLSTAEPVVLSAAFLRPVSTPGLAGWGRQVNENSPGGLIRDCWWTHKTQQQFHTQSRRLGRGAPCEISTGNLVGLPRPPAGPQAATRLTCPPSGWWWWWWWLVVVVVVV